MAYFILLILVVLLLPNSRVSSGSTYYLNSKTKSISTTITITKKGIRLFLAFVILFLFSALRYGVGTDYFYTYAPGYIILRNGIYQYNYYEPAFKLLNLLCIHFSSNYQWIFVTTSFITYAFLFVTIRKYSIAPKISFLVYFLTSMYFNSLSNIRQAIAMTICLLAFEFLINSNQKMITRLMLFYAFVIIAYLFHSSAMTFVIVPLLHLLKNYSARRHLLIGGVAFIVALVLNFSGSVGKLLNVVLQLFSKYQRYNSSGKIYWAFLAFNVAVYLFMYLASMNEKELGQNTVTYLNVQFVSVIVLLFSNVLPVADRLARYFMIIQTTATPHFIKLANKENWTTQVVVKFGWIALLIAWCLFYIFSYGADGCFPYKSILFVKDMWQKGYFGN